MINFIFKRNQKDKWKEFLCVCVEDENEIFFKRDIIYEKKDGLQ